VVCRYYIRQRAKEMLILFFFFLDSVEAAQHTDTVNELPIAQGNGGQTVWHLTALRGNVQLLENFMFD